MTIAVRIDREAPEGFAPLKGIEGFVAHNGPIYLKQDRREAVFGFRVQPSHCNPLGICHGGWLAAAMDMVLPLTARVTVDELAEQLMLTVSLAIDYLGGAPLGAWVEGRGQVLKRTKRLVFTQGLLQIDGEVIARGSGVFRLGPTGAPRIST